MPDRNIQYLKEILQNIQNCTRPLEHDANPNALSDCWKEVFETVEELIGKAGASAPADNLKAITDKVAEILAKRFPKAVLKADTMATDKLIMFSAPGHDYCTIKIED